MWSAGILARHLGVSVPAVNRWLNGISTPNAYQFRAIAHYFSMPYDWFLEEEGGVPNADDMSVKLGLSPGDSGGPSPRAGADGLPGVHRPGES